jgi:hypothetical protein
MAGVLALTHWSLDKYRGFNRDVVVSTWWRVWLRKVVLEVVVILIGIDLIAEVVGTLGSRRVIAGTVVSTKRLSVIR